MSAAEVTTTYTDEDAAHDVATLAHYKDMGERLDVLGCLTRLIDGRGWALLGYDSWQQLCDERLGGMKLWSDIAERRELVAHLSGEGVTVRAIGQALGVGVGTVHRDQQAGVPNGTPDAEPAEPRQVTGLDGKKYPARPTRTVTVVEQIEVDTDTGEIVTPTPPLRITPPAPDPAGLIAPTDNRRPRPRPSSRRGSGEGPTEGEIPNGTRQGRALRGGDPHAAAHPRAHRVGSVAGLRRPRRVRGGRTGGREAPPPGVPLAAHPNRRRPVSALRMSALSTTMAPWESGDSILCAACAGGAA